MDSTHADLVRQALATVRKHPQYIYLSDEYSRAIQYNLAKEETDYWTNKLAEFELAATIRELTAYGFDSIMATLMYEDYKALIAGKTLVELRPKHLVEFANTLQDYLVCAAKNLGPSTVCLPYNDQKEQAKCKYYKKATHSDKCMWLGHGQYCQSLEAQKELKGGA